MSTDSNKSNTTLKRLRKSHGMTQRMLAKSAGCSLRTIKNAEAGQSISARTLSRIAACLGVAPVQLSVDPLPKLPVQPPSFLAQQHFPIALDPHILESLQKAAAADMKRNYPSAQRILNELLQSDKQDEMVRARILVRLASVLDNRGENSKAVGKLQELLQSPKAAKLPQEIYDWVRYHLAVAQRRLATQNGHPDRSLLGEAARTFQMIYDSTRMRDQRAACNHQLGVIALVRGKAEESTSKARKHFHKARKLLFLAASWWSSAHNFREGYSLRRLADLDYEEGKKLHGLKHLIDALVVFSHHGCDKYVEEVRERILREFRPTLA